MKQILKSSLIIITFGALLSFIPNEEKKYPVTQTVNEWRLTLFAITNPDDITPNQRKEIVSKIADQINKQIADTTKPKK